METRIDLNLIQIPTRQRREISDDEITVLAKSIDRHTTGNLIHPIVVTKDGAGYILVVGERRLRAFKKLAAHDPESYSTIPARLFETLSEVEQKTIELEENIKRVDLSWKDKAEAVLELYELNKAQDSNYTVARLSGDVSYSVSRCEGILSVARELRSGNERIHACTGITAAIAQKSRSVMRAVEADLLTFGEVEEDELEDAGQPGEVRKNQQPGSSSSLSSKLYEIRHESFHEFVENYSGKPFNMVHCDFPYEVGLDSSDQFKTARFVNYDDSTTGIYVKLLESLASAVEKGIISQSAHMLFWFPMSRYVQTLEALRDTELVPNPYPLVWVKADKVGIIPDVNRYPRRIYETAFLCSRGDRKLVLAKSNAAIAPSQKRSTEHASYKPVEMLREFLPMFIDESSRVLDPTCGSGSALQVALELGAEFALGLDTGKESVELAERACKIAKLKRES